jgi:hypothetical protein
MDTTEHTSARRTLIAGLAALPAIGIAGQLRAAESDPKWNALIAEYRGAKNEEQRLGKIFNAAENKLATMRPTMPERPRAPSLFNLDGTHKPEVLHSILRGGFKAEDVAYERAREQWHAECDRLHSLILADAERHFETAVDQCTATARCILRHPVRTIGQLAEKLEILTMEFGDFGTQAGEVNPIIADVRRLAGRA